MVPILFSRPTTSTSSPTLILPDSILPVPTVPLPVILKTSSTGIKNGLSIARSGCGINESQASISSPIHFTASASLGFSRAFKALPLTIGVLSPSNLYSLKRSLNSISTNSNNSGSSTWSTLFMKTTILGTLTCRASNTCSLV